MSEYIICYDIASPRRLARIHRALKKHSLPLQYSVFLFSGTDAQLQQCLAQLEQLMDPRHDDIRAYPLPQRGLRLVVGPSALPEGILLASLPPEWRVPESPP
jgi:CRISPR-associated protein Cas2